LLIGYGRIGRRVAERARPFGTRILVVDPAVDHGRLHRDDHRVTLHEGLREADVVSLHASGTEPILGADEFATMRDGVMVLNSARGELVDEDALLDALDSGKVAAAWFDAFWHEPYRGRLCAYDQVLLTPHMSTYTRQCRLQMETTAVHNLLRDLDTP
jgi:D-3-phosphoglycerate dehydrogenase